MKNLINKAKFWANKIFLHNAFGFFSPLLMGAGIVLVLTTPIVGAFAIGAGVGLVIGATVQEVLEQKQFEEQLKKTVVEEYTAEDLSQQEQSKIKVFTKPQTAEKSTTKEDETTK